MNMNTEIDFIEGVSKSQRYKYNVINSKGEMESWSGVFKSKVLADAWYNHFGKEFEKRGFKLVEVPVYSEVED